MQSNVGDIIKKYQYVTKVKPTKFKNTPTKIESASILSLSQTNISEISVDEISQESALFSQLKQLKDNVLNLLITYQKELQSKNSNFKSLRSKLKEDTLAINKMYGEMVQSMKQNAILPGQETLMVMNIIEEFVSKFSGQVSHHQPSNALPLRNIMMNSNQQPPTPIINAPPKVTPLSLANDVSNFLQISNISHINFALHEDTFYNATTITQISSRLHDKIDRLRIRLEKILSKEQLTNTRLILKESINDLNQILAQNELKDIKRIVYKLEQTIQKFSETKIEGSDALNLYQLLRKAIKFSKKKESLTIQRPIIEEKLVTFMSSPTNGIKVASNTFTKVPTHVRGPSTIQSPQSLFQKSSYVPADQSEFLNLCLKNKAQLPLYHPGRRILIFQMFDQILSQKIPQSKWQEWIVEKLNQ